MNQFSRQAIAIALLMLSIGCSRAPSIPVDPDALPSVRCTIKMGNNPIESAVLVLHSTSGAGREITGRFDPESESYSFVTSESGKKRGGVPEGDYTLTVKAAPNSKTKIPTKYSDPAKSELKIHVKRGDNVVPPIELTT